MKKNNHRMSLFLLVVFLFFLFFPSPSFAQSDLIPGSYRMEYGGIYKIIVGQSNKFLASRWFDQDEELYDEGIISYSQLVRRNRRVAGHIADWKNGPPWYYRRWWQSLEEKNGGAPETPQIIRKGRTYILVDLGIIYLTNAGEIKWRGLELAVDFNKKSSITLGVGERLIQPRSGWKFRFYPNAKISTRELIKDPFKSINRTYLNVSGVYSAFGRDMFAIIFNTWYDFELHSWNFGIELRLLRW
jgi:hypothetical protein